LYRSVTNLNIFIVVLSVQRSLPANSRIVDEGENLQLVVEILRKRSGVALVGVLIRVLDFHG